jgi:hypothetical protein
MTIPISGSLSSDPSPASLVEHARSDSSAAATPARKAPSPPAPDPVQQIVDTVKLSELKQAEVLQQAGVTVQQIARMLGIPNQVVTAYLSPPRAPFPNEV